MKRITAIAALASALLSLAPAAAHALDAPSTYVSSYKVYLLGFKIGVTDVVTTVSGNDYRMEGHLRSAGLARIFDKVDGSTTVTGTFTDDGPRPSKFAMHYVNGGRRTASKMTFSKGDVVTYEVAPKPKSGNPRYVSLSQDNLLAVADPFTSLMIKADRMADVCNRTVKAFDGELRADFRLSDPKVVKISVPGYTGPAVTCKARFVPVAGYYENSSTINFLRKRAGISITFAPHGGLGVYAPVGAAIQSTIGWVTVRATRFGERR